MSKLTAPQEAYVRDLAAKGATLSDIQNGLRESHDVHLTYMEARFLMIDLNLTLDENKPQEPEPPKPEPVPQADQSGMAGEDDLGYDDGDEFGDAPQPGGAANITFSADAITRPGSLASGEVGFSDGKQAKWYVDGQGRLGIVPPEPGYQPPPADVPEFQRRLAMEMRRLGMY